MSQPKLRVDSSERPLAASDREGAPMGREVVLVQWPTKEPGQREFKSRGEAIRFVIEELENSRSHNVQTVADGTVFGIVDIVRMYAGRNLYRFKVRASARTSPKP